MEIASNIRSSIDENIQSCSIFILVISKDSLKSQYVEQEIEKALELKRNNKEITIFPIRLDNEILKIKLGWANYLKNTLNIGDFTNWENKTSYKMSFQYLLKDLR